MVYNPCPDGFKLVGGVCVAIDNEALMRFKSKKRVRGKQRQPEPEPEPQPEPEPEPAPEPEPEPEPTPEPQSSKKKKKDKNGLSDADIAALTASGASITAGAAAYASKIAQQSASNIAGEVSEIEMFSPAAQAEATRVTGLNELNEEVLEEEELEPLLEEEGVELTEMGGEELAEDLALEGLEDVALETTPLLEEVGAEVGTELAVEAAAEAGLVGTEVAAAGALAPETLAL